MDPSFPQKGSQVSLSRGMDLSDGVSFGRSFPSLRRILRIPSIHPSSSLFLRHIGAYCERSEQHFLPFCLFCLLHITGSRRSREPEYICCWLSTTPALAFFRLVLCRIGVAWDRQRDRQKDRQGTRRMIGEVGDRHGTGRRIGRMIGEKRQKKGGGLFPRLPALSWNPYGFQEKT